ncbi:hypothetical protein EYR36_008800 [Pleurotus pulmonarius]|nr:hypothetical protein EYR36_008800 [Pleurotus pulmonarius]
MYPIKQSRTVSNEPHFERRKQRIDVRTHSASSLRSFEETIVRVHGSAPRALFAPVGLESQSPPTTQTPAITPQVSSHFVSSRAGECAASPGWVRTIPSAYCVTLGITAKGPSASDPIVAATDNSDGVSDVEIEALSNGGITFADTPAANNSIGLDIIANDVGYFATILLGTPPREFRVIMDSGSADLWVGAEDCDSDTATGCGNHVFLGGISSTTFEDSQRPFQITYGTGAVVGTTVRDNLKLAGLSLDGHIFGVAHNESKEFAGNDVAFDGILGTAQSTLSNQKTPTAVESLAQNGLIQDPITSYKISRLDDQKNDGVITFGGLDDTKFDPATLVTVDNLSRVSFWEAVMDKITVNGADTRLTRRTAILDTGTTLILAPDADARALHQAIPGARSDGQGGFIIPCTTNATIALTFGGREFSIDPRDLVFAPLNLNDPTGDCFSGITSGSIGGANQWLVGDVFLKSAYFSHNVKTNSMSLAALA